MKISSWAAIGWFLGKKLTGQKIGTFTDVALGGLLAKNEVLDVLDMKRRLMELEIAERDEELMAMQEEIEQLRASKSLPHEIDVADDVGEEICKFDPLARIRAKDPEYAADLDMLFGGGDE